MRNEMLFPYTLFLVMIYYTVYSILTMSRGEMTPPNLFIFAFFFVASCMQLIRSFRDERQEKKRIAKEKLEGGKILRLAFPKLELTEPISAKTCYIHPREGLNETDTPVAGRPHHFRLLETAIDQDDPDRVWEFSLHLQHEGGRLVIVPLGARKEGLVPLEFFGRWTPFLYCSTNDPRMQRLQPIRYESFNATVV